jgi:hypothetical protein
LSRLRSLGVAFLFGLFGAFFPEVFKGIGKMLSMLD